MDLYHKKVNLGNKSTRRPKYGDTDNNAPRRNENVYISKMMPRNETFDLGRENIPNVRSSMEDLFANEDKKKNAIKYVINIGKNKTAKTSPNSVKRRFDKSASPARGRGMGYPLANDKSYEATPNRRFPDRRGDSQANNRSTNFGGFTPMANTGYNNLRKKNKFNDNNNSYRINTRPKKTTYPDDDDDEYENPPEESNNDIDLSSMNEADDIPPNLRNIEPKILNRVKNVLNDTYERAARRLRNKEINAMPKIRKPSDSKNLNKTVGNVASNNLNTDEEIDDLYKELDDMQRVIDKQKHDLRKMKKLIS